MMHIADKKILFLLIILSGLLGGNSCSSGEEKEKNPVADSLQEVNMELQGKLSEKEAALMEFINSFNEIQENLETIKEKEGIITRHSSGSESVNKKEQIKEDIQAIYDLMQKNKNRLNALSEKLKNSNLKIEGLYKMIENLQKTLQQKDAEIAQLKSRLEALHIELTNLETNYKEIEKENQVKEEKLKTAYYIIGTQKELKEKKIISKTGGFIGIGKSTTLNTDISNEYFTRINIDLTLSIPLGGKKVKIITSHPSGSYELIMNGKIAEKLEIKNPEAFWSISKYLVIQVE